MRVSYSLVFNVQAHSWAFSDGLEPVRRIGGSSQGEKPRERGCRARQKQKQDSGAPPRPVLKHGPKRRKARERASRAVRGGAHNVEQTGPEGRHKLVPVLRPLN